MVISVKTRGASLLARPNAMVKGIVKPEASVEATRITQKLKKAGAEGITPGYTGLTFLSLPLVRLPLFDTTKIHVDAALEYA